MDIIKTGSTLLLKTTLVLMGLVGLAIAIFVLPNFYEGALAEFPYAPKSILTIVVALYAVTLPYFFVLLQSWKLLVLIDKSIAFSLNAVHAFRNIKFASFLGCLLLMIGFVPFLYPIAEVEDAPGLLLYGFLFACIPFVVSVFAALLEKVFQNAVEMKSENDLTI